MAKLIGEAMLHCDHCSEAFKPLAKTVREDLTRRTLCIRCDALFTAAANAERALCLDIVCEVQEQAEELIKQVNSSDQREYYRGRGLGAATIAARIQKRNS